MKLEKLQKLQIWLTIISTIITIVCNIRSDRRKSEEYERWMAECDKLDAKIHNFEPVKETPKKEEEQPELSDLGHWLKNQRLSYMKIKGICPLDIEAEG